MRSVTEMIASNAGMKPSNFGSGFAANGINTADPRSNTTTQTNAARACRRVGGK
jgi:hypothetical protein